MANVSAPYNFVPLNDKVFFPPWANLVNHDVPFENGLSGQIELEITAETPIFIRGKEEVSDDNATLKQYRFPKKEDRYYIPGSSIKGEISNVLEIMSFSKLRIFNDVKYSQREWTNTFLYDKSKFADVKGGWLSKTEDGYRIQYNKKENPGRIAHLELNNILAHFSNTYATNGFEKNAKHKYSLTDCLQKNNNINFINKKFTCAYSNDKRKNICSISETGISGDIVFTGQSSNRNENAAAHRKGKGFEFIFWKPTTKLNLSSDDIRIKSFKTAYDDGDSKKESVDWKMWKEQLNNGLRVPIFITVKNGKVAHFGLSMLYKLPYDYSIKELIEKKSSSDHTMQKLDFVQSIFGTIDTNKTKGRVHFSHAFSTNNPIEFTHPITTTLGSPKPTFYPFYIKQKIQPNNDDFEISNAFATFNNGSIAGRKRYPAMKRNSEYYNNPIFDVNKSMTTTTFFPLKEGCKFTCKVSFFNLLEEDLGGLLSALTFHNNKEYNHSIGMGKPLGLGSVNIKIRKIDVTNKNNNIDNYLGVFEKVISTKINDWATSNQLKELFALATPIEGDREEFAYLKLNIGELNTPNINEFNEIKLENKGLPSYSTFMGLENIEIISKMDNCQARDFSELDVEAVFEEKKSRYQSLLSTALNKIQNKMDDFTYKQNISIGISLDNVKTYSELITAISQYKKASNIDEQDPIPENDILKVIIKLEDIYAAFNGKKKKQFITNNSKLKTVVSWIGKEKAADWFNSKQQ